MSEILKPVKMSFYHDESKDVIIVTFNETVVCYDENPESFIIDNFLEDYSIMDDEELIQSWFSYMADGLYYVEKETMDEVYKKIIHTDISNFKGLSLITEILDTEGKIIDELRSFEEYILENELDYKLLKYYKKVLLQHIGRDVRYGSY